MDVLNEREQQVLEAVIRTFVDSAEPAGSRTVARHFPLGVSAATIRNTMADLEEKGFLYHPHTSAGRIPTDLAYRYYVNTLMRPIRLSTGEQKRLRREIAETENLTPLDRLVQKASQVLGLVTGELGVAIAPRPDRTKLEKLELASISSEKVLLVLTLQHGLVRTIYVDLPISIPAETLVAVTMVLNERLAGQTLAEIRKTLPERLRDTTATDAAATELLNIFVQQAEDLFDWSEPQGAEVHLGRASILAGQPEFASGARLRHLIELTERRDLLADVLTRRGEGSELKITIGGEHREPELSDFTVITSEYRVGRLSGVIGVVGPTRMPYEKVATLVGYTSSLVSELAGIDRGGGARA